MSNTLPPSDDKDTDHACFENREEFARDIEARVEQLIEDTSEESPTFYRLRTKNWAPVEPYEPLNSRLDLTPEEIKFSLEYFQQCVTRSRQMTNTYDDADAVNALLKEREKDIELAANIGLELLELNTELRSKVEGLTEDLAASRRMVCQLRHELTVKEKVIRSICNEGSDAEDKATTEVPHMSPAEMRQWLERIKILDAENKQLKVQADELKERTEASEEKEKRLVRNCASKLASVNAKLDSLHRQMRRKSEECANQRAHIEQLVNQIGDLQKVIKKLTDENDELTERVQIASMLQSQLENQVTSLTDSYDECVQILESSQKEARHWRSLSLWRSSEDDLDDAYRESCLDAIAAAAARQIYPYESYPGGCVGRDGARSPSGLCSSELIAKFQLCRVLNQERDDSADPINTSRFTLADSGMHSDLDSDEHYVVMRQPKGQLVDRPRKLPARLMLVKPFEGSAILKRWRQLATPSLANLLEDRPGIYGRLSTLVAATKAALPDVQ